MNRLLTALVISGLLSTGCETQTTTPARSSATESSTTSSETPEKPIDPPESADSSAAVAPVAPDAAQRVQMNAFVPLALKTNSNCRESS
jgi:hypothetical protein